MPPFSGICTRQANPAATSMVKSKPHRIPPYMTKRAAAPMVESATAHLC